MIMHCLSFPPTPCEGELKRLCSSHVAVASRVEREGRRGPLCWRAMWMLHIVLGASCCPLSFAVVFRIEIDDSVYRFSALPFGCPFSPVTCQEVLLWLVLGLGEGGLGPAGY